MTDAAEVMSAWSQPCMVAGFAKSGPNPELMRFAAAERTRVQDGIALGIGCGAARNLLPLVQQGWRAVGVDASPPMLTAAAARLRADAGGGHAVLALGAMDALPVHDAAADVIVAHGIWNLARSGAEFRRAVREAARAAKPGAALFVFTFSVNTLPVSAVPVPGESFVFTQFSGQPQCFLSERQLMQELRAGGFEADAAEPLREYNRPATRRLAMSGGPPVIYEAVFRYAG